jgi:hypothetical protein
MPVYLCMEKEWMKECAVIKKKKTDSIAKREKKRDGILDVSSFLRNFRSRLRGKIKKGYLTMSLIQPSNNELPQAEAI